MSGINANFAGNLTVANNITSTSGIYTGNGSGLTHLSPGSISGTPTNFAFFDPTTGVLTNSSEVVQLSNGNINIDGVATTLAATTGPLTLSSSGATNFSSVNNLAISAAQIQLNSPIAYDSAGLAIIYVS